MKGFEQHDAGRLHDKRRKKLEGLRGILGTKDAHGLYRQYGFERVEGRFMARKVKGGR